MRLNIAAAFLGVICLTSVSALPQAQFTRTAEFCPVSISYQQLVSLIGRVRDLVQKANAGAQARPLFDRISLEQGDSKFESENDFSLPVLSQGPETATSVRYWYSSPSQPISAVTFQLGDFSRSITVSGTDRTQVDSLLSLVSSDFSRFGCALGGSSHRMLGFLALVFIGLVLTAGSVLQSVKSPPLRAAFLTIAVVNIASLVIVPWSQWLPGTAVRLAEASFIARNSPIIGFVGTLAGVVSLVVSVVALRGRKNVAPTEASKVERRKRPRDDTAV